MTDDAKTLPPTIPVLPEPPPEEYPRPFGNYLLLAPLARGGMGEVFLAKHGAVAGLEKHCVVKTLRPHLTDDREYTSRFIDEARIVVQLGHRNICHVFDVGTVGERYYLAMEFINGKDLRALAGDVGTVILADGTTTEKGGVITPGLSLHIVSETLEALDYAHRQIDAESGTPLLLVHRDVSPQNVMLSWEGEVKLIDFGLAASTLKVEQTSPNVVMGKLAYMAPEQVRGERVDGRADLFAAGVMLSELLIGERFYEGRSPYEIWGIAAQGGYRPRGWTHLNDDMKAILDRALAGSPAARYSTCNEMREALQGYLHARGLRGDAPMLRALMQTVYASAIEESRRTLSVLTKAKVSHRAATGSGASSGPTGPSGPRRRAPVTEPTISLVRSPSQSIENKRMLAAAAGEGTEPTEMMERPKSATPRTSIAAAAVGLLAVAAIVALVAARMQSEDASVIAPVVVAPMIASVVEPVIAPVIAPVVAVEPIAPVVAPVVAEVKPHVKIERTDPKRDKRPKKPKVEPVTKVVEPVVAKVEDAPLTWKSAGGWGKRVEVLAKSCGSQVCTADVAKHREDWGSLNGEAFKVWRTALQACWTKCGLP